MLAKEAGETGFDQGVMRVRGDGGYVQVHDAGTSAKGEFQCVGCGYGITVHTRLPACPMCGGRAWQPCAWSPFTRSGPSLL